MKVVHRYLFIWSQYKYNRSEGLDGEDGAKRNKVPALFRFAPSRGREKKSKLELNGTKSDCATLMKHFHKLTPKGEFYQISDETSPGFTPRKITEGLGKLSRMVNEDAGKGKVGVVVVCFFGHGVQLPNNHKDKKDKKEPSGSFKSHHARGEVRRKSQAIVCPSILELYSAGIPRTHKNLLNYVVKDREFRKFVESLPKRTRVLFFFDCCHSGTMCDLKKEGKELPTRNTLSFGQAICISGCENSEKSLELMRNIGDSRKIGGVATSSFINNFPKGEKKISIASIKEKMQVEVKKVLDNTKSKRSQHISLSGNFEFYESVDLVWFLRLKETVTDSRGPGISPVPQKFGGSSSSKKKSKQKTQAKLDSREVHTHHKTKEKSHGVSHTHRPHNPLHRPHHQEDA